MPGLKMQTSDLYSDGNREATSQQSLLSAMNRFVHAVNDMDETIMIPSRLKDMPSGEVHQPKNGSTQAVISPAQNTDLYTFYSMLNAVKTELVRGPKSETEEEETEQDQDDLSRHTAQMFRHHLRGLFTVLSQLTDTAQKLTKRYQEEVGDTSMSTRSISSFL